MISDRRRHYNRVEDVPPFDFASRLGECYFSDRTVVGDLVDSLAEPVKLYFSILSFSSRIEFYSANLRDPSGAAVIILAIVVFHFFGMFVGGLDPVGVR